MDRRIDLPAIACDQRMVQFVDQAHGEQRAGVDDLCRIGLRSASLVELVREPAACSHVRKDYIPGVTKK